MTNGKVDLLIFAGQSNMQGSTGEKCNEPPLENCAEYRFLTDTLVPLASPVGEDIGDGLLAMSALGNGSLVPYFCREYCSDGTRAVAVHVAKGNTRISEWEESTERFAALKEKVVAAADKIGLENIRNAFVIWLQGESDAIAGLSESEYLAALVKLKNVVKKLIRIRKFALISPGYFACRASWVDKPYAEKRAADERIMSAYRRAGETDDDFIYLTDECVRLSENSKYLNPKEFGPHYNNAGMEIIGTAAAKALKKYVLTAPEEK